MLNGMCAFSRVSGFKLMQCFCFPVTFVTRVGKFSWFGDQFLRFFYFFFFSATGPYEYFSIANVAHIAVRCLFDSGAKAVSSSKTEP